MNGIQDFVTRVDVDRMLEVDMTAHDRIKLGWLLIAQESIKIKLDQLFGDAEMLPRQTVLEVVSELTAIAADGHATILQQINGGDDWTA